MTIAHEKAPAALTRPEASEKTLDICIIQSLADEIKDRLQVGEEVSPMDYAGDQRLHFWSAIIVVRDQVERIRPGWKTVEERHVDGTRVRQRIFRLQAGSADLNYAVSIFVICGAIGQIAARVFA
jgi:hypothetical protein